MRTYLLFALARTRVTFSYLLNGVFGIFRHRSEIYIFQPTNIWHLSVNRCRIIVRHVTWRVVVACRCTQVQHTQRICLVVAAFWRKRGKKCTRKPWHYHHPCRYQINLKYYKMQTVVIFTLKKKKPAETLPSGI